MFNKGDTTFLQLINPWPSNSRSIWNLEMLVFEEGGKLENPEKNPWRKGENQQQTRSSNRTRDTLAAGKHSHHCAILCSPNLKIQLIKLISLLCSNNHMLPVRSIIRTIMNFKLCSLYLFVTLHGKTGIKVIARSQHVYTARLVCPKTRFI